MIIQLCYELRDKNVENGVDLRGKNRPSVSDGCQEWITTHGVSHNTKDFQVFFGKIKEHKVHGVAWTSSNQVFSVGKKDETRRVLRNKLNFAKIEALIEKKSQIQNIIFTDHVFWQ